MKFSGKLVASCTLAIAIIFSLGASWMIVQNHEYLLSSTLKEKESALTLQGLTLESKLNQDLRSYEIRSDRTQKKLDSFAIRYIRQYAAIQNRSGTSYILQDASGNMLFSNGSLDSQTILSQIDKKQSIYKKGDQVFALSSISILSGHYRYTLNSYSDISPIFHERSRQYQNFIMIDLVMLSISFLLLYGISQYLTRPIRRLNLASQRIASGSYEERTRIDTSDEIGELSRSFDEMAAATQHTIEELKDSAAAKEEFMSSFSHEIKTPMTAIMGFADMLRTYECDEETRRDAAGYIYQQGKRLENLSQTLMQLLSLSSQKPIISDITITALMDQLKHYYDACHIAQQLHFTYDEGMLHGNEELLFTLLMNLIDNACKASCDGAHIHIRAHVHEQICEFSVKDEGIGMSSEELQKIEQPFYMADRSRSREKGGAGLGLSIASKICELHHTHLQYVSAPDKGTTVSFVLEVRE